MSPETQKQKLRIMHFAPEGYVADNGEEFYQQLADFLRSQGFDTDSLLYSGTDAALVLDEQGHPKVSPAGIFAMNEAGWLDAVRNHDNTPAAYADKDGGEQPCVLLYDRSQLAEAQKYNVSMEDDQDYNSAVLASDIIPGEKLQDLPVEKIVNELVIHKDFPDAAPSDALVGIVYLEEPAESKAAFGF